MDSKPLASCQFLSPSLAELIQDAPSRITQLATSTALAPLRRDFATPCQESTPPETATLSPVTAAETIPAHLRGRDRSEEEVKGLPLENCILSMSMTELASILGAYIDKFESLLLVVIDNEKGQAVLKKVTKTITNNIQFKLANFLGEE